ncbi:MAG: Unknown protein [uncultured Sulfurovum sp.]|uniref:Porin domain-containing protein n=1 Tax=uncultured Sulfurovum sp. TaxID=269237 RepID=A0A6S6RYV1_9BACT|nr:MAG: Unknown protein [uncultured Sulfurovum sp.]
MKLGKLSLLTILSVSAISTSLMGEVEVSANISAVNNYVWRGMTQTNNTAAIQGGFDVDMNGFYVGTWTSNVDFSEGQGKGDIEVDGYVGYSGELATLEYDLGFIRYGYLTDSSLNGNEIYFSLSKNFGLISFGATYSKGLEDVPDDIALNTSIVVMQDYNFDLAYGHYDQNGEYYSIGLSKSFDKIDFSLIYHNFSPEDLGSENQKNVVVGVGTSF